MKELWVGNVPGLGQISDVQDTIEIRRHVRRAVLRDRQSSDIGNRMRHYSANSCLLAVAKEAKGERNSKKKHVYGLGEHSLYFCQNALYDLRAPPSVRHPYTAYTVEYVQLPADRIDFLFKSHFFQNASEPLFNSSHVDAAFRMDVVFPGCLTATAFLNALLYSIVQMANKGKSTPEGLRLQGRALQSLRQNLSSLENILSPPDIGAIMMLQGVAYRWNDLQSYNAAF